MYFPAFLFFFNCSKLKGSKLKWLQLTISSGKGYDNKIHKQKKRFLFINTPHSLVDDDSNSVFSYIKNFTSLAMVKLVWHALLNSSMTLQWKLHITTCNTCVKLFPIHCTASSWILFFFFMNDFSLSPEDLKIETVNIATLWSL